MGDFFPDAKKLRPSLCQRFFKTDNFLRDVIGRNRCFGNGKRIFTMKHECFPDSHTGRNGYSVKRPHFYSPKLLSNIFSIPAMARAASGPETRTVTWLPGPAASIM